MKIGIAGTGKMGSAIAGRLAALDHEVHVWNRSRPRAQPLVDAGLRWAETPAALSAAVDLVISLLTNEQALEEVYLAPDGLLSSGAGKIFIDMSTVKPAQQVAMAAHAAQAGARYLECPVGGSVGPARDGKLIGFVGGAADDLAPVQDVLHQLCRRLEHVGPHGAGATMKLAINLPLMVYWQTLGEALSLIEPLGLEPQRVVDILADTSGGPNMLKVRGPMIAQALAGTAGNAVTVDVATMRKDMRTMLDHARGLGRSLPLTEESLRNFDRAAQQGLDGADCAQLPVWWLRDGRKA